MLVTITVFVVSFADDSPVNDSDRRWKLCGNERVRVTERCPSEIDEGPEVVEEPPVVEEEAAAALCLSLDEERMAEFSISDMVYYHDVAHALYSTYATDTDPMQYFVEGVESNDLMMSHKSVNANGFTKYEPAVKWALLANCYQLSEDVMKQATDLGFIEEGADPDKRLTQKELLNLFMNVSELEADAYAPDNYNPKLKVLRRDAWQWVVDVAMLSEKLDDGSKELLKSFVE